MFESIEPCRRLKPQDFADHISAIVLHSSSGCWFLSCVFNPYPTVMGGSSIKERNSTQDGVRKSLNNFSCLSIPSSIHLIYFNIIFCNHLYTIWTLYIYRWTQYDSVYMEDFCSQNSGLTRCHNSRLGPLVIAMRLWQQWLNSDVEKELAMWMMWDFKWCCFVSQCIPVF